MSDSGLWHDVSEVSDLKGLQEVLTLKIALQRHFKNNSIDNEITSSRARKSCAIFQWHSFQVLCGRALQVTGWELSPEALVWRECGLRVVENLCSCISWRLELNLLEVRIRSQDYQILSDFIFA